MWNHPKEEFFLKVGKHAKIAGVIFLLLGIAGVVFPMYLTLSITLFVAYLMLFAGMIAGSFTWASDKHDWLGWLKSFILVGSGLLMIFYPITGVATLGLLFAIYFFMDGFAGLGMASSMYPHKNWWFWLINGLLSLVLGVLFLMNWPFSSMYLIGFFVRISLFFDGLVLIAGGSLWTKMAQQ